MKNFALSCAFFFCLTVNAHAAEPFWMKQWKVARVVYYDPDEGGSLDGLIGRDITLEPTALHDNTYDSCASGVDYADIQLRPTKITKLRHHLGDYFTWPKLPAQAAYGQIRCQGYNQGGYIFVNDHKAYRLYEEGAILELN